MYKHILVALDGSDRAERALPYAVEFARRFGARLSLLRATTVAGAHASHDSSPARSHRIGLLPARAALYEGSHLREVAATERKQAASYLRYVSDWLDLSATLVTPHGPAAEAIVAWAAGNDVDLIAMTTHGKGGPDQRVPGSVADEVVCNAGCPVLLVPTT